MGPLWTRQRPGRTFATPPARRLMSVLKHLLTGLVPCLLLLPWMGSQASMPERTVPADVWLLVIISAVANLGVIAYHFVVPAHPKFLLRPWRRWVLRIHILSGLVELVAGLFACFAGSPTASVVMALAALCFHVPSAFLQLPIVFGSRAIMEPAYLLCIIWHAFSAGMLLMQPTSHLWAVNTFLIFNIYVWCRLYFYAFDLLHLFRPMKYSVAILAAGITIVPAVFGVGGLLAFIGFVAVYIILHRALISRSPAAYADFVREKARDTAISEDLLVGWQLGITARGDAAEAGATWFRHLDRRHAGQLDREDLRRALSPWNLALASIDRYADQILQDGPIDQARFLERVWSVGAVRQQAFHVLAVDRARTDRDKAELVFLLLDFDRDGVLSRNELDALLGEWGLPASETAHYLSRAGGAEGRITLPLFIAHLEPVWRFIFHEILRARQSSDRGEMIGRGMVIAREEQQASGLRGTIRRELLQSVPFLAGASEDLVGNLAASLVVERYRDGAVVMREGEPGNAFYLVAAGGVAVERRGTEIARLGRGGSIGEGALLTNQPRTATVVAAGEATLFALSRDAFAHLTSNFPDIRRHLERLHKERQSSNADPTS